MSFNVAMLEAMQAEGLDLDACIRVLRAGEKKADPTAAERKRRQRAKAASRRDVTRDPPNDNISNPPCSEAKASSPRADRDFPKPDWADGQVWSDFMANRKRKRATNSKTAHKKFLADIEQHSDHEWPPPRLLEHAAASGWAGIYDPRESRNGKRTTGSRTTDALLAATPNPDEPF